MNPLGIPASFLLHYYLKSEGTGARS